MEKGNTSGRKIGGIPVNIFAFPLLIVVAILHIFVILLIVNVNRSSSMLSELMKQSGSYQLDATSLQGSANVLSETSGTYVQLVGNVDSEVVVDPLLTYAREWDADRRSPKVLERFRNYDVSREVLSCIEKASALSDEMVETQIHAISLINSVYPFPDSAPELKVIPLVPLTSEEQNMPAEARIALAKRMMIDREYVQKRFQIAECITGCNRTLQQEFDETSAEVQQFVATMRLLLWITIFTIIFVLLFTFVMFYRLIVRPIRKYSLEIDEDKRIEPIKAIAELRRLVNAHNDQWDRRTELESFLRTAAETDSLTGLPNRYCLERDFIENESYTGPLGVLLLDVNFLKHTNDTKGHLAGDKLLFSAASCIKECFANEAADNCYRIGGDEFVVFYKGITEAELRSRIDRFHAVLRRENISISLGCAYEAAADGSRFRPMMEKADRDMYEQKRLIHEKYQFEAQQNEI
ncbi:MAG: GGDEF domain-containing protein [Oscillospiraceae bacterium]|nr:GGDEF domain-containing protein [Oscillospiraceae bacterium]